MEEIEIIQQEAYPNEYGTTYFLEKLLLVNPFKGLYEISPHIQIPDEVIKTYRDYVIFHLEDFFDFAFEEVEEELSRNSFDIQLLLIKYKNSRNGTTNYFISITRKIKNIKQFLSFYRKGYTEKEFLMLFNEIVAWKKQRES